MRQSELALKDHSDSQAEKTIGSFRPEVGRLVTVI